MQSFHRPRLQMLRHTHVPGRPDFAQGGQIATVTLHLARLGTAKGISLVFLAILTLLYYISPCGRQDRQRPSKPALPLFACPPCPVPLGFRHYPQLPDSFSIAPLSGGELITPGTATSWAGRDSRPRRRTRRGQLRARTLEKEE